MSRAVVAARDVLVRLAWVAIAVLVALGGAGLVTAMDHLPSGGGRPELTSAGDATVVPALDAATDRLRALAARVDTLGTTARRALTQVVARDLEGLQQSIDAGGVQVLDVQAAARQFSTTLDAVPGMGADAALRVSPSLIGQYATLRKATALADGLAADWVVVADQALDASRLTTLLTRHDQETAAAAKAGSAAHYADALRKLDASDATMARARELERALGETADVSTLTTWLDRNAEYDAALRALYQALVDSNGRLTKAARDAFAAERAARDRLPADNRPLVVIMANLAQGGLNQAVIDIEEARGALDAAIQAQEELTAEPSPGS